MSVFRPYERLDLSNFKSLSYLTWPQDSYILYLHKKSSFQIQFEEYLLVAQPRLQLLFFVYFKVSLLTYFVVG